MIRCARSRSAWSACAAGCATLQSWTSAIPTIPVPSFGWLFGKSDKPGPLPELTPTTTPQVNWQVQRRQGGARPRTRRHGQRDLRGGQRRHARAPRSGERPRGVARQRGHASIGRPRRRRRARRRRHRQGRRARVRRGRQAAWTARVSSEVVAPPRVAEGVVVVFSGDGRIYASQCGRRPDRWVNQRTPPRAHRSQLPQAASSTRGGVFAGTPGGRLLALDVAHGHRRLGRDGGHAEGRHRARADRRRHRPAAGRRNARCARSPTRAASPASRSRAARCSGRATCRSLTGLGGDAQVHLRHRRQGQRARARPARPARRCGSRTCSRRAQDRRSADGRRRTSASSTSKATCTCSRRRTARTSAGSPPTAAPPTAQPELLGGALWQSTPARCSPSPPK